MNMVERESPVDLGSTMTMQNQTLVGRKIDSYWAKRLVEEGREFDCRSKKM